MCRLNFTNGCYLDARNVTITPAEFGNVSSLVGFLDILPAAAATDNLDIVQYFLKRGYTQNKDIRAAPYDWRLGSGKINNFEFIDFSVTPVFLK